MAPLSPTVFALSVALLAVSAASQERVSTDVTRILGSSPEVVWFEKDGTVWVADGDGPPMDTGVRTARHAVHDGALFVYPGDRVHRIAPSGDVITRVTPVRYDGPDAGRGFRVWRGLVKQSYFEAIEIFEWTGSAWLRIVRGVGDPAGFVTIEEVLARPDRYLVLWTRSDTVTDDLLSGSTHWGTGTGSCWRVWQWTRGVLTCAEDGGRGSDAFNYFEDFGPADALSLPSTWGWGAYDFTVQEPTLGFPWIESHRQPEFVPFLVSRTPRVMPGDSVHSLFWITGGSVLLADATIAGMRLIVSSTGGSPWTPVPALAGLTGLTFVGEGDGLLWIGAFSATTGHRVIAFDPATGAAMTLLDGLVASPGRGTPLAGGMLFPADDGVSGEEPWFSDGTLAGTRLVADLRPGAGSSTARELHVTDTHAFWLAEDGTGRHLFALAENDLDWRRSPVDGRWYRLTEPMTWFDARREARRLGGDLVTIRSAAAQEWLWSTFGGQHLWIGLQDFDRDDRFEWVSGEPLAFTAWCPGEPGRNPVGEDVVHMAAYPGFCTGGWNDQQPTDRYRGIVERATRPRAVEPFGSGCDDPHWECASLGAAELLHESGRPRVGESIGLRLDLRHVPTYSVLHRGLLALAFDNTEWNALRLPLDLEPLGWPAGCRLWIAILALVDVPVDDWGVGHWQATIPNSTALVGTPLFAQGIGIGTATWRTCLETSNALRLVIGGR